MTWTELSDKYFDIYNYIINHDITSFNPMPLIAANGLPLHLAMYFIWGINGQHACFLQLFHWQMLS